MGKEAIKMPREISISDVGEHTRKRACERMKRTIF